MDYIQMEIHSEAFDEIVEDIKQRNLSRNHMPKLIVGTGLSIIYGVPGMKALAEYINNEMNLGSNHHLKSLWNKRYSSITEHGLEAGLAGLTQEETELVDAIKHLTAKYILESEEKLHDEILDHSTGFSKLVKYLHDTVSENNKVIDIMTPNYDRIIEIVCDKLGIGVITGFVGSVYCQFKRTVLSKPHEFYNCKQRVWVRLFKPHGSLNWISENGKEYLTNDFHILKNKPKCIEIVTPGSSKYREGLINNTFRCMREEFNELLSIENDYSLFIYGYGFNDDHFDTAIFDSFQRNVLILSKEVKTEIIHKAMDRKNITIFYHEGNEDYMIYKSQKYKIDLPLWDIEKFADIFIG